MRGQGIPRGVQWTSISGEVGVSGGVDGANGLDGKGCCERLTGPSNKRSMASRSSGRESQAGQGRHTGQDCRRGDER